MKYQKFNYKMLFFIKIILFCFILSTKSYSDDLKKENSLVTLGSDKAEVKIKIFSSLTCPHCANFHIEIVPKIKKEYIDTGKVQLIFIDFPLDQIAFNASKLLHCLDKNNQMAFLDTVYETQSKWTSGTSEEEINANLKKIVKNLGISPIEFDKCLVDEAISDKILNGRINASKKYSVNSTPAIVINEKKLEGSVNFETIKKRIEKLI
tara:strand:- start:134 stop:757 length:624 start_codon:yes stop_codon:yes gene_type:complete